MKTKKAVSGVRIGVGGIVAMAALALPGAASAKTVSDYHPDQGTRDFRAGAGGWESDTSSAGLCVQGLTCPVVTNSHVAGDGTGGAADGHLRVEVQNLAGADATARGIWRSPSFEYTGVGGQEPTELSFELAKRTELSALLATSGTAANYSVEIVEVASGVSRTVIDTAPLGAVEGWARTPQVTVKPSALTLGSRYRIKITSTFNTEAEAFPASYVDYDDVILRAVLADGAGGDDGDGDGDGGGGGGDGTGGPGGNPGDGNAMLRGNRLFLRLKCLGVQKQGRCKVRAVAHASKRGARLTYPVERKIKAKRGKVVALRVRPRFVKQLTSKDKVMVRSRIKAGDRRKTRYKSYSLSERR